MSQQPPRPPTVEDLRRECIGLVNRLSRHRLNVKLLLTARSCLRAIAAYKQRRDPFARGRKTD